MITGNKGEWSEPYVLLKLIAEGNLYLGDDNFQKIQNIFYPIISIARHEKDRNIVFSFKGNLILISDDNSLLEVPISEFKSNATLCFEEIKKAKSGKGSFGIPEIESFLSSFSINTLKAKSKLKNDITVQIQDPNTFLAPSLGFSVKSQLGRPSTLVNASGATNFTYVIEGYNFSDNEIDIINKTNEFSKKIKLIKEAGAIVRFEKVDDAVFRSNLQTVDFNFDKVLSEMLLHFYENNISSENTVAKFVQKISVINSIGYDLAINSSMYELMMKRFLTDYALGMRASEVWKRDYQATGGYLIVRTDGEIICYHFYFTQKFEEFLFTNTKFETPDPGKHGFGMIYMDNDIQKIKLNLQVRFIK